MKSVILLVLLTAAFFTLVKLPMFNQPSATHLPVIKVCDKKPVKPHEGSGRRYLESWPYLAFLG